MKAKMKAKWREDYKRKVITFAEAAKRVKSGEFICIGLGIDACSPDMYHAILDQWEDLRDIWISDSVQVHPCRLYNPVFMANLQGHINYAPVFGMKLIRKINEAKLSDFFPVMTSDSAEKYAVARTLSSTW